MCEARISALFPLFALCGAMVYAVAFKLIQRESYPPFTYPLVQADSILDHILEYFLIVPMHSIIAISSQGSC
jgi:hypothetical protein